MRPLCTFIVPGNPVPKARPRVVAGRTYTPERTAAAEARIAQYFKVAYPHMRPTTARLVVVLTFHIKGTRGDIDNFSKLVLDALNGKLWADDQQIDRLSVSVYRNQSEVGVAVSVGEAE